MQRLAPEAACALGLHGTCNLEIDRAISAVGSREIRPESMPSATSRQSIENLGIRVKNALRLRDFCESLFRTIYLEMTFDHRMYNPFAH